MILHGLRRKARSNCTANIHVLAFRLIHSITSYMWKVEFIAERKDEREEGKWKEKTLCLVLSVICE